MILKKVAQKRIRLALQKRHDPLHLVFDREFLAILSQRSKLRSLPINMALTDFYVTFQSRPVWFSHGLWHQNCQFLSDQLRSGVAEGPGGGRIDEQDFALLVNTNHRVSGRLDDVAVLFLSLLSGRFYALPLIPQRRFRPLECIDICDRGNPFEDLS